MNKSQRAPWVGLTAGSGWILCSWCRFGDEVQNGEGSEMVCEHPLSDAILGQWGIMEPGVDCWAFRPRKGLTPEDAARHIAADQGEMEGE